MYDLTYVGALENLVVYFQSLLMNHDKFGCETLTQTLCELFFHWHCRIGILLEAFNELVEQITQVSPFLGGRESMQDVLHLISKSFALY